MGLPQTHFNAKADICRVLKERKGALDWVGHQAECSAWAQHILVTFLIVQNMGRQGHT